MCNQGRGDKFRAPLISENPGPPPYARMCATLLWYQTFCTIVLFKEFGKKFLLYLTFYVFRKGSHYSKAQLLQGALLLKKVPISQRGHNCSKRPQLYKGAPIAQRGPNFLKTAISQKAIDGFFFQSPFCVHMGVVFQKNALPTLFNYVMVRESHQPHVSLLSFKRVFLPSFILT